MKMEWYLLKYEKETLSIYIFISRKSIKNEDTIDFFREAKAERELHYKNC